MYIWSYETCAPPVLTLYTYIVLYCLHLMSFSKYNRVNKYIDSLKVVLPETLGLIYHVIYCIRNIQLNMKTDIFFWKSIKKKYERKFVIQGLIGFHLVRQNQTILTTKTATTQHNTTLLMWRRQLLVTLCNLNFGVCLRHTIWSLV